MQKQKLQTKSSKKPTPKRVVKSSKMEIAPLPIAVQTYFKPSPSVFRSTKDGGLIASGSDLLDFVPLFDDSPGSLMMKVNMNPQDPRFSHTRLGIESIRFEKYRFTKLNFKFLPEVGTSQKGSIIFAYDPDAADNPQTNYPKNQSESLTALQTFMAYRDSEQFNLWLPASLNCKVKADPQKFYYTSYNGGDIRLAQQGSFYVVIGSSTGLTPEGQSIGKVAIDWEIEFWEPTLETVNAQVKYSVTGGITPDTTPNNAFNTVRTFNQSSTDNAPVLSSDNSGNYYFDLAAGTWDILSTIQGSSAVNNLVYNLIPNIADFTGQTILSTLTSATSGALAAKEVKAVVPQGGGKLYGSFTTSNNLGQFALKLTKMAFSTLL